MTSSSESLPITIATLIGCQRLRLFPEGRDLLGDESEDSTDDRAA